MARLVEDLERDAFLADAESLEQLISHPAWARFDKLLGDMRATALEQLAVAAPIEVPYWQAVTATIREIRERPAQIVTVARTVAAEEQERKQAAVGTPRDFAAGVTMEDDL